MIDASDFTSVNSGKASFDDVYNRPDPRGFFRVFEKLDYSIPDRACPVFRRLIEARRNDPEEQVRILDLGCSYGVNAAELKCGLTVDELARHYRRASLEGVTPEDLLRIDREFFQEQQLDPNLVVLGLDVADAAVRYGEEVGLLDRGLVANLEAGQAPPAVAEAIRESDMVISTGCVGYVGEGTFAAIADAADETPWVASFVLRMFPYDAIAETLAGHGLETEKLEGVTFRQRRFYDDEEAEHVRKTLAARGIDFDEHEADGWYHAELYVSRPPELVTAEPLDQLLAPIALLQPRLETA